MVSGKFWIYRKPRIPWKFRVSNVSRKSGISGRSWKSLISQGTRGFQEILVAMDFLDFLETIGFLDILDCQGIFDFLKIYDFQEIQDYLEILDFFTVLSQKFHTNFCYAFPEVLCR